MYIPDLRNLSREPGLVVYAIGWLDRDVEFVTSDHPNEDVAELTLRLMNFTGQNDFSVHRTRGLHYCNICGDKSSGSNACVVLPSTDPSVFFVTNLLLPHYVSRHRYQPPEVFLEALRRDYTTWLGPPRDFEQRTSIESPEGEKIEKERLEVLLQRYPELRKFHE